MTAGVLVDTFIVRSMLVPALTSLFGEVAWWPGQRVTPARTTDLIERVGARAGVGPAEAERATRAALCTLAERITRKESKALAAQLPGTLADQIRGASRRPERFGADEFVARMGEREGVPDATARAHARAVLTTLEDNATDRLAYVRAQLSDDYAAFFTTGRADGGAVGPLRIDQHARIEQPGRVQRVLGRAQGRGERVRALRVVPRPVVAADAVVVRDRAARVEDRAAGGGLHLVPLRHLLAAARGGEHGEVGRRAVGIDVREAARDAARLAERRLDRAA